MVTLDQCFEKCFEEEVIDRICPKCKGEPYYDTGTDTGGGSGSCGNDNSNIATTTATTTTPPTPTPTNTTKLIYPIIKRRDEIWRLPPVLVIQFKRFMNDRRGQRKLYAFVDFPCQSLR